MSETMTETPTTPTEGQPASDASTETLLTSSTSEGTTEQTPVAGTEEKAADPVTPEGAPESYDFKAPEGKTYDPAVLAPFSEAAKNANLTQDAAQKMLETMAPALAARQQEQVTAVQNGWMAASKADTEFGGDKLNENLGIAKKALDTFGSDAMRTLLKDSGLGNNPEVIRFMYRVGKGISEDGFVGGSAAPVKQRDIGSILYDKTGVK